MCRLNRCSTSGVAWDLHGEDFRRLIFDQKSNNFYKIQIREHGSKYLQQSSNKKKSFKAVIKRRFEWQMRKFSVWKPPGKSRPNAEPAENMQMRDSKWLTHPGWGGGV